MSTGFSAHRRDFLKLGAAGLTGGAVPGIFSASPTERKKTRSRDENKEFVDAHVHLWTNDFAKYPLAKGFAAQDMKPPVFLPEEILRHARPCGVNRIVLVQMSYYGFDNSYMLDVIRHSPNVFSGIAIVDWKTSRPDRDMRNLAGKGVRGFRIYSDGASAEAWLDGEGFDKMFRCGAKEHLPLCVLINPDEIPALERQCKRFPDTPVVVDHLARIGMKGAIEESATKSLCALARYPLMKVKVSAFYALGKKKPPHLDLAPLVRRVFDAFGPERLMWASDCPFQVADETYEDSISLIRDRLDFLSNSDKEWMLRRTAEETFFR